MDHFCLLFLVSVMLSDLFIAALWSPSGKGWPLGSLVFDVFLCFYRFPMWCPGLGVVLDGIDSRSLPSSLF